MRFNLSVDRSRVDLKELSHSIGAEGSARGADATVEIESIEDLMDVVRFLEESGFNPMVSSPDGLEDTPHIFGYSGFLE